MAAADVVAEDVGWVDVEVCSVVDEIAEDVGFLSPSSISLGDLD